MSLLQFLIIKKTLLRLISQSIPYLKLGKRNMHADCCENIIYSCCCDQIGYFFQVYNQMALLTTIPLSFFKSDPCQILVIKIFCLDDWI